MKPGESDCAKCLMRPLDEGGSGQCPFRGAVLAIHAERRDCPRFREGDYVPKVKRGQEQEEALF